LPAHADPLVRRVRYIVQKVLREQQAVQDVRSLGTSEERRMALESAGTATDAAIEVFVEDLREEMRAIAGAMARKVLQEAIEVKSTPGGAV
jgi:F0F1-type ATP synthase membrane subunit b/b'